MAPTNVFSAILVITTLVSYIPQYNRLLTLRCTAGLSIISALLNTLVAQAQAINMYYLFKSAPLMRYGVPIATPRSTRDCLNLTQILVQWLCSLILLALVISLPASANPISTQPPSAFGHNSMSKKVAAFLWIAHVLLFILAIVAGGLPQGLLFNIVRNLNAKTANPFFTLLAVIAFCFQVSLTWAARDLGALSKWTLGLQCVIYLLLALSWPFRLILPRNMWELGSKPALLFEWYPWVGWTCVNNAIVAIGQAALLFAISQVGNSRTRLATGEGRPLLAS